MTEVIIRRAVAGDADLLSRLNADVHAVHAKGLPHHFKPPSTETFPASLVLGLLAKPRTLMFLGYVEDAPAGYLYAEIMRLPENEVRYEASMVYIHHISVRLDFRAMGVGKALLHASRSAGHDLGITRLGLDVWTFNEAARSFFRSQGFVVVQEVMYQG